MTKRRSPQMGGKCTHRLTVEVEDGAELTVDDAALVSAFFGANRVFLQNRRYRVYLAYWAPLTKTPRTMKAAGYGDLPYYSHICGNEDLAKRVGREILRCDVEIDSWRKDNGEAFLVAHCSAADYERTFT